MTIVKVPTKRASNLVLVLCDECKKSVQVAADADLPLPWREVTMKGWVGSMHACSDGCETGIRARHERDDEEELCE
jgi:hypothetical protein